eukprot:symbB.v1.2.022228.t3/scaffold1961.1/size94642/4
MACRGTRPAAPEDGQDLPTNQQAQQISRCCCTGEFVEAKCQVVSDGPRRALHWTLHPSMTEEVGHNSSETWPSRLWAFEVKSWIPFELRGRNHEDWRWQSDSAGIDALPEPWKRHGQRWSWAHDGNRVNGWIEFGDAGRLTSKWGAGFWHPVGDDQFLVVGMNSMAHLLRLTEDTFEVISKRPAAFSLSSRLNWLPRTLFLAKSKLHNFLIAYVCLVAGFSLLMTLYFGDIFQQFSSLQESFCTLLLYSFGNTERAFYGAQPFIELGSSHLQAALFFYTVFVVTIILNMFTTIVIDAFAAEGDPERYEKTYQEEMLSVTHRLLKVFGKGHLIQNPTMSRQTTPTPKTEG